MKQRNWIVALLLCVVAALMFAIAISEAGVSAAPGSAPVQVVEIPGLPGTDPQVVVYRDTRIGRWVVAVNPRSGGSIFVDGGAIGTCPPAKSVTLQMGDYVLTGPAVLNGWTNKAGQSQAEFKLLIQEWDNPQLLTVGGSLWQWTNACTPEQIAAEYQRNPLLSQTIADLRGRGLAQ